MARWRRRESQGGAGVVTLASDTFTRTNAASIGSADVGGAYTVFGGAGTWATDGTKGYLNSATNNTAAVLSLASADVTVQVTNNNAGAAGSHGLCFRATDTSNYWQFLANGGTNFIVQRIVAGAPQVADATYAVVPVDNDVMKVVCSGTSLTFYRNGVSLGSLTSAFGQTATKHGLAEGTANTGVKFDDLLITAP